MNLACIGRSEGWNNLYFALRHGESVANVRGVIASSVESDKEESAGLTPVGRRQIQSTVESSGLDRNVLLICSDFIRAYQSADIAAGVLGCGAPMVEPRLRERYFGDFEGTGSKNYARVWSADARGQATHNVESPEVVRSRALSVVREIDAAYAGRTVVLVAHGDTLQILQTAFMGIPAADHRSLRPLSNAELRQLNTV